MAQRTDARGRLSYLGIWLLVFALGPFGGVDLAHAQEVGSPFPDIDRIVKSGEIRVALIDSERAPLVETGAEGEPVGFDVNLARRIASGLGVEAVFVRTEESFDAVVDQVSRGDADIGLSGLSWTASRATKVLFSKTYLTQAVTVLVNRVRAVRSFRDCPSLAELVRFTRENGQIGFVAASAYIKALRDYDSDLAPQEFDSLDVMLETVASGEILASVQGEIAARQYLLEHRAAAIHLRLCELEEFVDGLAIAVRPDALHLARWLDQMLTDERINFTARQVVLEREKTKL